MYNRVSNWYAAGGGGGGGGGGGNADAAERGGDFDVKWATYLHLQNSGFGRFRGQGGSTRLVFIMVDLQLPGGTANAEVLTLKESVAWALHRGINGSNAGHVSIYLPPGTIYSVDMMHHGVNRSTIAGPKALNSEKQQRIYWCQLPPDNYAAMENYLGKEAAKRSDYDVDFYYGAVLCHFLCPLFCLNAFCTSRKGQTCTRLAFHALVHAGILSPHSISSCCGCFSIDRYITAGMFERVLQHNQHVMYPCTSAQMRYAAEHLPALADEGFFDEGFSFDEYCKQNTSSSSSSGGTQRHPPDSSIQYQQQQQQQQQNTAIDIYQPEPGFVTNISPYFSSLPMISQQQQQGDGGSGIGSGSSAFIV